MARKRKLLAVNSFQCRGPRGESGNDVGAYIEHYTDGTKELYCSQWRESTDSDGRRRRVCRYKMASEDECPYAEGRPA